jgi:hypothetical protein
MRERIYLVLKNKIESLFLSKPKSLGKIPSKDYFLTFPRNKLYMIT